MNEHWLREREGERYVTERDCVRNHRCSSGVGQVSAGTVRGSERIRRYRRSVIDVQEHRLCAKGLDTGGHTT